MSELALNTAALDALALTLTQGISFFIGGLTAIAFTIAASTKL